MAAAHLRPHAGPRRPGRRLQAVTCRRTRLARLQGRPGLRPVFHPREDRIRAHIQLCWLALLLLRVIEIATGDTWRNVRRELDRMHVVTLATNAGQVAQRTTTTPGQQTLLCAFDLPESPQVPRLHPPRQPLTTRARTTWLAAARADLATVPHRARLRSLPRRRPPCGGPGRSRWTRRRFVYTGDVRMSRVAGPSARAAAPQWCSGTGTASITTGSPTPDGAPDAARCFPAASTGVWTVRSGIDARALITLVPNVVGLGRADELLGSPPVRKECVRSDEGRPPRPSRRTRPRVPGRRPR